MTLPRLSLKMSKLNSLDSTMNSGTWMKLNSPKLHESRKRPWNFKNSATNLKRFTKTNKVLPNL